MKIAILSDIHGNLEAFTEVLKYINSQESSNSINSFIFLGDLIDYGPHSNEVIELINTIKLPILCNIWGNHEYAIMNQNYEKFSSSRGIISAKYTFSILNDYSKNYIKSTMQNSAIAEIEICSKKCLCVHASIDDNYWGKLSLNENLNLYSNYDFVFFGHSHEPLFFEKYYKNSDQNMRNRKKTIFINPGSVGQPRNQNPMAQFAILDINTQEITFKKIKYNIDKEIIAFSDNIDEFYKNRLKLGV